MPVEVPCGQCTGCRLEKSRQWAIRCIHEASLYKDNCFITLTYSDKHIPENGTLVKKHFQDFIRSLRKRNKGKKIRYYHCGEYGDKTNRPHYHALLFNYDFADKVLHKTSNSGFPIYTSQELSNIWEMGFATIGDLSFETAAYTARYVMKKLTGKEKKYYEERGIIPEYSTMSRRPGIGAEWFSKWKNDVYPSDFIVVNGKKCKVPKFYDSLLLSDELLDIKKERTIISRLHEDNNTTERLRIREECTKARTKLSQRTI